MDLLEDLIAEKLQKAENIHLIGFSLGAHLCGIVGKTMKDAGKEVSRITGTIKKTRFFMKIISVNLIYITFFDTST